MHAGKKSGPTNRNVGNRSCKACQTGLLAIPALSRHPSETCFEQPTCPDLLLSLFMTYYLLAELLVGKQTRRGCFEVGKSWGESQASQGGDSTSTFFCSMTHVQPDGDSKYPVRYALLDVLHGGRHYPAVLSLGRVRALFSVLTWTYRKHNMVRQKAWQVFCYHMLYPCLENGAVLLKIMQVCLHYSLPFNYFLCTSCSSPRNISADVILKSLLMLSCRWGRDSYLIVLWSLHSTNQRCGAALLVWAARHPHSKEDRLTTTIFINTHFQSPFSACSVSNASEHRVKALLPIPVPQT